MSNEPLTTEQKPLTPEQKRLLAEALRSAAPGPVPQPIPSPDEDPLLNSLNPKKDRQLEEWLRQKSKAKLRTQWL